MERIEHSPSNNIYRKQQFYGKGQAMANMRVDVQSDA